MLLKKIGIQEKKPLTLYVLMYYYRNNWKTLCFLQATDLMTLGILFPESISNGVNLDTHFQRI